MVLNDRGGVCSHMCDFSMLLFMYMLYAMALSDTSICNFELQTSAIMHKCNKYKNV